MNKVKLFRFNPTCEMAVANGQISYMPPAHLRKFEYDLATLPSFLGDKNDFVYVPESVNQQFIEYLSIFGFELPRFISSADELTSSDKIDLLCPWGWSPVEHKKFRPFLQFCHKNWFEHPFSQWKNEQKNLLSRETTCSFISQLNKIDRKKYNLVDIPVIPLKIKNLDDLKTLTDIIQPPVLLKTPLSASGRGHFKIRDIDEHAEQNAWVKSKFRQQGIFYAEPFLKKVLDVSFHFMVEPNEISFLGTVFFETDVKGQFTGCYIRFPEKEDLDIIFIEESCKQATDLLLNELKLFEINKKYQGPLGIDAIFFEKEDSSIKLNPCIEINLRHTMGLINLFLRKRIHPEKNGKWSILKDFSSSEDMKFPEKQLNDGFINKGSVLLTPPTNKLSYIARLVMCCLLICSNIICQQKTTIYCFPGQGSDARLFDSIQVDTTSFQLEFIEYGTPDKKMNMNEFAYSLINKIDTLNPYILLGVSLGGMICVELNESLNPQKTIIISSAKNRNEFPFRYRFQKTIPLYKLFPKRFLLTGAKIMQPIVESDRNKNKETFKSMLNEKSPVYMKRTINMLIRWERKDNTKKVYHIHGDKDNTLPFKKIQSPDFIVKNGSHMMTLTRGQEINNILNLILSD